jgi:lipopolysaccharide transport system ATP-binding protein
LTPALSVRRLSKRYRLGELARLDGSFREMLVSLVKAPVRHARRPNGQPADASFWALRDVSFDVQPGEVVGVIGPNGAGKSTLLKILSRITDPTEGRVELRGRVASLLEVGTGFHPELTGRENIFLNGAILGMKRAEILRKFDAIVDFAEVSTFLETPVKHYSSGMYLRLAFSVAAHLDGETLLVDEVLAVGDAAFQKKCLGKMQDVSRGGRTVLFISHNMAAVSSLCARAIVMDHGEFVFDGPARDGVRHYLENNLASAALGWDLATIARTHDDLAALARIEHLSAMTARADGFRFGEPLRFRVGVAAAATFEDVQCAIGLDDMYGSRVVTFISNQRQMSMAAGRRYEIEVTVPPFGLRPGKYLLSVSLSSGGHYHDYLVHFGAVSVVPLHEDGGGHVDDRTDRGPVAVPSEWRLSQAPARALA